MDNYSTDSSKFILTWLNYSLVKRIRLFDEDIISYFQDRNLGRIRFLNKNNKNF